MNRINGLVLMGAGVLLMAPLGLIPFSNTLPGVAILLLAAGISQRDGLVVVAGYVMVVLTIVYFAAHGRKTLVLSPEEKFAVKHREASARSRR